MARDFNVEAWVEGDETDPLLNDFIWYPTESWLPYSKNADGKSDDSLER